MHNTLKIAVADNHVEYREVLAALLTGSGFKVVLSAGVAPDLLQLIDPGNLPDIIVISCSTMYPESIALIRELKNRFPSIKVLANVVFIHYLPDAWLMKTCIDGWVIKTMAEPAAIIKAIHKACSGL
jgi:DNA-binding NarL/FixJ family response regulator